MHFQTTANVLAILAIVAGLPAVSLAQNKLLTIDDIYDPVKKADFGKTRPAREATIADLLSRGLTNPMIAERLSLSTKTVANYVSAVILKLGAQDRDEAARIVRKARRHRSS